MVQKIVEHPEIKLIGLQVRTSYAQELNPATSKIGATVGRYFSEGIPAKLPARKNPGRRIAAFTNYESDEYGAYDYFIGEEVSSLNSIPEDLSGLTIPAGKYLKITSEPGPIPMVIIETWQKIWALTKTKTLHGQRTYKTDFEIYDQRATHPEKIIFDIYLGIK